MDQPFFNQAVKDSQSPDSLLCSCIDIGTNSVKLLTADMAPAYPIRFYERSIISRLGEGMRFDQPLLQPEPIARTLAAVGEFYDVARSQDTKSITVVGTAALREAKNRDALFKPLKEKWGVNVEVLSGEEEARLSYMAVRKDPLWRDRRDLIVIDIGGGSTEIVTGRDMSILSRISTPLGAVRITEAFLCSDPPTEVQLEKARKQIEQSFPSIANVSNLKDFEMVGVGGTISTLGCMIQGKYLEAEALHGKEIADQDLSRIIKLLEVSSISSRKEIPGLDPRRNDIILGGAQILQRIMGMLAANKISISSRGLRWGVLYDKHCS